MTEKTIKLRSHLYRASLGLFSTTALLSTPVVTFAATAEPATSQPATVTNNGLFRTVCRKIHIHNPLTGEEEKIVQTVNCDLRLPPFQEQGILPPFFLPYFAGYYPSENMIKHSFVKTRDWSTDVDIRYFAIDAKDKQHFKTNFIFSIGDGIKIVEAVSVEATVDGQLVNVPPLPTGYRYVFSETVPKQVHVYRDKCNQPIYLLVEAIPSDAGTEPDCTDVGTQTDDLASEEEKHNQTTDGTQTDITTEEKDSSTQTEDTDEDCQPGKVTIDTGIQTDSLTAGQNIANQTEKPVMKDDSSQTGNQHVIATGTQTGVTDKDTASQTEEILTADASIQIDRAASMRDEECQTDEPEMADEEVQIKQPAQKETSSQTKKIEMNTNGTQTDTPLAEKDEDTQTDSQRMMPIGTQTEDIISENAGTQTAEKETNDTEVQTDQQMVTKNEGCQTTQTQTSAVGVQTDNQLENATTASQTDNTPVSDTGVQTADGQSGQDEGTQTGDQQVSQLGTRPLVKNTGSQTDSSQLVNTEIQVESQPVSKNEGRPTANMETGAPTNRHSAFVETGNLARNDDQGLGSEFQTPQVKQFSGAEQTLGKHDSTPLLVEPVSPGTNRRVLDLANQDAVDDQEVAAFHDSLAKLSAPLKELGQNIMKTPKEDFLPQTGNKASAATKIGSLLLTSLMAISSFWFPQHKKRDGD